MKKKKRKKSSENNYNKHHIRPRSRKFGGNDKYNKFPWLVSVHDCWHFLFSDYTLQEIWDIHLKKVHNKLFFSNPEANEEKIIRERAAWYEVFGSENLDEARKILKIQMCWLIFAKKPRKIRENKDFIKRRLMCLADQIWAWKKLFPSIDVGSISEKNLESLEDIIASGLKDF